MENIAKISLKSNEFLALHVDELVEILSSDDLNVKNEEIVFDAILRWINHDPENRKQYIINLLKCVRLGLLSTQYFVEKVKVSQIFFSTFFVLIPLAESNSLFPFHKRIDVMPDLVVSLLTTAPP